MHGSRMLQETSAEDTIGIIGYYVSESSDTPDNNQFNTIEATAAQDMTISFTLSVMPGIKTLYTWFVDAAGNISSPVSNSVNFSYGWFNVFGTQNSVLLLGEPHNGQAIAPLFLHSLRQPGQLWA